MPSHSILDDYLAGLDALLTPPDERAAVVQMRAGEVERPPSPFDEKAVDQALAFLQQSRKLQALLAQELQEAASEYDRSLREIQLLGAAAADLAIAERLMRSAPELAASPETREVMRSRTSAGRETLIQQAIRDPASLLIPQKIESYRGANECETQLKAATWNCLESVRKGAIEASQDAIDNLLTMPLAVVREAAEALGSDLAKKMRESSVAFLKAAVEYILSATDKLRTLLGPEGEEAVKNAVLDFLEKLKDGETVANTVSKFLNTRAIYNESKTWLAAYSGDPQALCGLSERIGKLQTGFEARMKIVDGVTKGLAVAALLLLRFPPWGPLGAAAGHILLVGYILYSAYDHVDSDRFAFFDRVQGVRGLLMEELGAATA